MKREIEEYQEYLKAKGRSQSTLSRAGWTLGRFLKYLEVNGNPEVTSGILKRYRDYVVNEYRTGKGERLSNYSIRHRLLVLNRLFQYLVLTRKRLINPMSGVEIPKKEKALPRNIPTDKELQTFIDHLPSKYKIEKRDKAIFEVLYSAGLRARELLNLNVYDIDFHGKRIVIRQGKGRKDRVVPLGEKAQAALRDYIDNGRPRFRKVKEREALFLSTDGTGLRLTYRGLNGLMQKHHRKIKNLSAHRLRHACAMGMLSNGADIRYIQELLGHKHLTSTQIYTRLLPKDLKEAQQKYHL